jgi:hypothetical protein
LLENIGGEKLWTSIVSKTTDGSKSNIPCCAAGARIICVGFANVARIRRESGAYVTQMLRAKLGYAYMQMLRTPTAGGARNKGCCKVRSR